MKRTIILSLFLTIHFIALGQPSNLSKAKEYIVSGDSLFNKYSKYQDAMTYYKKAGKISKKHANGKQTYYYSKLRAADCLYEMSRYDELFALVNGTLKRLKSEPHINSGYEMKAYVLTGKYWLRKSKFDLSWQYLQKAIATIKPTEKRDYEILFDAYLSKGILFSKKAQYKKAVAVLKNVLLLTKKHLSETHLIYIQSTLTLGMCYHKLGNYNASLRFFLKSLEMAKTTLGNHHLMTGKAYYSLAVMSENRGDNEMAAKYFKRSLDIVTRILGEESSFSSYAYGSLCKLHFDKGAYDLAIEYGEKGLAILLAKQGKDNPDLGYFYAVMANCYDRKKQHKKALSYGYKNLRLLQQHYSQPNIRIADAYHTIGFSFALSGKHEEAAKNFEKALKLIQKVTNKPHIVKAKVYQSLGKTYLAMNDTKRAVEYLKYAAGTEKKLWGNQSLTVARSTYSLAEAYVTTQNYEVAARQLQVALTQAIPGFSDSTNIFRVPALSSIVPDHSILEILNLEATCFYHLYLKNNDPKYLQQSIKIYNLAYDLVKKTVQTFLKIEDKMAFNETILSLAEGAITAQVQQASRQAVPSIDKVFKFAEMVNANILKNSLDNQNALNFANIPDALVAKEKQLRREVTFWKNKMAVRTKQTPQYRDSLFKFNRAYEKFIITLEKDYPKYARLKYQNKTISVAQVQQKLDKQTVLLEYAFGETNSYLFVITHDKTDVLPIANDKKLRPLLNKYYNVLSGEARLKKFAVASHQLYNALLKPAEKYLKGKTRLMVVAPSLESIPFESLVVRQVSGATIAAHDFSQLAFLINQYQVSYHYSAMLWYRGLTKEKQSKVNFIAFAPFSTGGTKTVTSRSRRRLTDSLPESGVEVKTIFNLFSRKKKEAQIFLARAATKERFITEARNYSIVHIASHSEANTKNANLTRVGFAPAKLNGRMVSGDLLASEVYNLELNADLLVLSSCESGVGKLAKGEGVLSLARSFLYAGARNIVFSLWEVNDTYTRKLMVAFYKALLSGKNYREALQAAQQINKSLHPKHWAGFVIIGE